MKQLNIQEKKRIVEYFYKNIKNENILQETIKNLNLDNNTVYWNSRIKFLKDFQDYILKNWIDENIKYIYESIAYNM